MYSSDEKLRNILSFIKPTDSTILENARKRLDSLIKPPGSLGGLEDIAAKLAAIGREIYYRPDKRCVIIMASDNGVVDENITSAPQSVTHMQTLNFIKGITGAAVLAKTFNSDLMVVDVGVNGDFDQPLILNRKVRKSTGNIAREKAMTREEALKIVSVGIEIAIQAKSQGYKVIGLGEMGIGNTTTSSSVLCGLLGYREHQDIAKTVGRGAGLDDDGYNRKLSVVLNSLKLHNPNASDPIDVISKVGGFDIAAMTGAYIGAAYCGLPVVIDGFISIVAAFCAYTLNPLIKDYMFASHKSYEKGYELALDKIGLKAPLDLCMRLGEGSGCPLMFTLMDAASAIIKDMATFEEALKADDYLKNISGKDSF